MTRLHGKTLSLSSNGKSLSLITSINAKTPKHCCLRVNVEPGSDRVKSLDYYIPMPLGSRTVIYPRCYTSKSFGKLLCSRLIRRSIGPPVGIDVDK